MPVKVAKQDCINVGKALGLEWLDTNEAGAYASSTILGCNTRRYHGLLVVPLAEPPGRFVLLSKLEDSLIRDGREHHLSMHQYPGVLHPRGHRYLNDFGLDLTPTFRYAIGRTRVDKEIALLEGRPTVLVRYQARHAQPGMRLRVRPLLAFRDFHQLTRENLFLRPRTFPAEGGFKISPYDGMPPLFVQVHGDFEFFPSPLWYRDFEYWRERVRGFDHHEDLFSPGLLEIELGGGDEVIVAASTTELTAELDELWGAEINRRRRFRRRLRGSPLTKSLLAAARQLVPAPGHPRPTVIAGYHWFDAWGRDALIALPGLTLYNGRQRTFLEVLGTFAAELRDGLIPNFIGPTPEGNAYNSADASLWFGWAAEQYLAHTGDLDGLRDVAWEPIKAILRAYRDGTRHGIRMLEDGLITAGSPDEQLTWMDATVNGAPVTPRWGCAVEINALWHELVCFAGELAARLDDPIGTEIAGLAERIATAFDARFWIAAEGRLGDVFRDGELDASMRPNQIFAASLPHPLLDPERAQQLLAAVERELLTPRGLRTLSPRDPRYRGRYEGGPAERDAAYHMGTVWPWLLGHYGEAVLRTATDKRRAADRLERLVEGFEPHLNGEAGLGTISEVFDGDPPLTPGGCISQAWSVAELIRLTKLIEACRCAS